jgi:hypothetical protein
MILKIAQITIMKISHFLHIYRLYDRYEAFNGFTLARRCFRRYGDTDVNLNNPKEVIKCWCAMENLFNRQVDNVTCNIKLIYFGLI